MSWQDLVLWVSVSSKTVGITLSILKMGKNIAQGLVYQDLLWFGTENKLMKFSGQCGLCHLVIYEVMCLIYVYTYILEAAAAHVM